MNQTFQKRVYDEKLFLEDLWFLTVNLPGLLSAINRWQQNWAFAEKIMLAVTSVNRCRYCTWLHTDLANAAGANDDELIRILEHETGNLAEHEKTAILYAYHYAETERNPSEQMKKKLTEQYGEKKAEDIHLFIRFIFFGNLSGNTFDALISRSKGMDVPHSNVIFEVIFAALSAAPLLGIALLTSGGLNVFSTLETKAA